MVVNVFDYLNEFDDKKEKYDMIIFDFFVFVKSIYILENVKRGYKEINL